ncbi:MAG: CoA ester lyase [Beijerinckiaceae bacterium]|nr:CoA ester lyase [Beijerinckiaceae bacterium]
MRSLLFVPADSERKFEKALGSGADAIILDLEDSVAHANKAKARDTACILLRGAKARGSYPRLYVRVNALDTGLTDADLDAVMREGPHGIFVPKTANGTDVQHIAAKLAVREAENGLNDGATAIVAIATETAHAIFGLGTYRGSSHRLEAITWGAEDLSADIGAETPRHADGTYTQPFAIVRTLALMAAHAADAIAIDTIYPNFRDETALRADCEMARRDGFTAKMAIHPDQVPVINAIFTPPAHEIERARTIVDLFAANPEAGVIGLDGEMLDRPHLKRAERLLKRL